MRRSPRSRGDRLADRARPAYISPPDPPNPNDTAMFAVLWRAGVFLVITACVWAVCNYVLIPMEAKREARKAR
jgi:hypothetical protein